MKRIYTTAEATDIAKKLGLDFKKRDFDLDQFLAGLNVEAEHGAVVAETNVTDDDPMATGKIALAHLNEIPDYYTRLAKMEAEGDAALTARKKAAAKRGLVGRIMPLALLAIVFLVLRALARRRAASETDNAETASMSWVGGASAQ